MLVLVFILVLIGLVMMFSASYANAIYYKNDGFYYIKKQAKFAAVGLVMMIIISYIPYTILHKFAGLIYLGSFGLLVLTLTMPAINDAKRWIVFGGFTFQPSEAMKFAVIILFAHLISIRPSRLDSFKSGFIPMAILLVLPAAVMLKQPHISGTIQLIIFGSVIMLIGGAKLVHFLISGAVGASALGAMIMLLPQFEYARERIETLINGGGGESEGWQIYQALLAIGSGGFFGLGLGNSRQKQLYVPEPQNDFILSIICEEIGFMGVFIIICLFIAFFLRGINIAMNSKDRFGSLLVAGVTSQIAIQTLLNIAVVTASIPNTGISLPFFSQGGTSILILLCAVGVILSVARYSDRVEDEQEQDGPEEEEE
ncbi:MAG: cell division protein FtsW [Oscillospiraceae bacterium]|nr:cell division protein FtsW [Oscillospiraceae bacterium]